MPNNREEYRAAWRHARLLAHSETKPEIMDRAEGWDIYKRALKAEHVDDWLAFQARRQLYIRDCILGDPMRHSLYFHHVRDGVLPRP